MFLLSGAHHRRCLQPTGLVGPQLNLPVRKTSSGSRQRKPKCRALSRLGLHREFAAVAFHDLPADGQSDTCTGEFFPPVESLEHSEDLLEVLRFDSQAIVLNGENPLFTAIRT